MGIAATHDSDRPMAELNTTPLIDVMLVLLVMFIITIPVASHSIEIDLPLPCGAECDPPTSPDPIKNKIVIDEGDAIYWNGTAITLQQMNALLLETRQMAVEPELQFEPTANAGYARTASILKSIKSTGVTKFGFVGNEQYRSFASAE